MDDCKIDVKSKTGRTALKILVDGGFYNLADELSKKLKLII